MSIRGRIGARIQQYRDRAQARDGQLLRDQWEQRAEELRETGRQQAQARGMRQAAARDGVTSGRAWQPGPVPSARQVRREARALETARARAAEPGMDTGRAAALRRASEQDLTARQQRARTQETRTQGRPPR